MMDKEKVLILLNTTQNMMGRSKWCFCSGGDGTLDHTMRGKMGMQKPLRIAADPCVFVCGTR